MATQSKPQFQPSSIILLFLVLGGLALNALYSSRAASLTVPYSEFVQKVRNGEIAKAEIRNNEIVAELKPVEKKPDEKAGTEKPKDQEPSGIVKRVSGGSGPDRIVTERIPRSNDTDLIKDMREHGVEFSGKIEEPSLFGSLIYAWILPMGIIFAVYYFGLRRLQGRGGPMSFGRNRAKLYDASKQQKVTFADVAGIDESVAEMTEVVDFLKNPQKYRAIGAKIPKGVLLVGPPGTGKTLMAKAVAGEASVPFFSMSGSDFVEMFVGVGAARVRDLFEQAKQRSPCIIFIDEIDAIGKSRGGIGAMATHDEREQTLNQLLSEMDGFDATQGVVIIAATNRPEVLDPALVRAGRFDRQVMIDRPDWEGRLAILKVHVRGMSIDPSVNLEVVARRTPGMVGADLAKVVNEAALSAARRDATTISHHDFEEAIDRIQLGLKKHGRAMNEQEKRRVASHESGHTIVALSVEHADPVHRVTIIPRTIGALGATLQLPTEDRYLMLKSELRDRICVMLGGRAAEEIISGDISTGAHNDLERATETARQMICRFGMSEKLGAQTFGRPVGARFLDTPVSLGEERNFSEDTARQIDDEVSAIINAEHKRALEILQGRRKLLDTMTDRLLSQETLEREQLERLVVEVEGSGAGAWKKNGRVGLA